LPNSFFAQYPRPGSGIFSFLQIFPIMTPETPYKADMLPMACNVYIDAKEAGVSYPVKRSLGNMG
jgi:hypothetical protein